MNKNQELTELFKESLEDYILSRSEKRNLKEVLHDQHLTKHEHQVLLSEIKKLALTKTNDHKHEMLINWMYDSFKLLKTENEAPTKTNTLFSPGDACREAICSQIRWAKSKIRICVFTISDDRITEELFAAKRNGKDIQIITDNDKIEDKGSDIDRLARKGIPVVIDNTDAHMHHKFALFDDETTLTGSYNWTRSASERNHENILLTNDPGVYRGFKKEFDSLWKSLSQYKDF